MHKFVFSSRAQCSLGGGERDGGKSVSSRMKVKLRLMTVLRRNAMTLRSLLFLRSTGSRQCSFSKSSIRKNSLARYSLCIHSTEGGINVGLDVGRILDCNSHYNQDDTLERAMRGTTRQRPQRKTRHTSHVK